MSIRETTTLTRESSWESYKAQEKTPTWKVVAAVAFLVIATVALVLFLASPLSPVAFPLSIALKPLIIGAGGVILGALGIGSFCIVKNRRKNTSEDPFLFEKKLPSRDQTSNISSSDLKRDPNNTPKSSPTKFDDSAWESYLENSPVFNNPKPYQQKIN